MSRPRLVAALDRPIVLLVAPAGYGKSTLLDQWCAHDPRPFAWLTLDRRHDDQGVLLRAVGRALDEAGEGACVLVLDDVHVLRSAAARETLTMLVTDLPESLTIALASRTAPPLPVARLRAQGLVRELRAGELALTRAETAAVLRGAGLRLAREELEPLLRRTEGWPAAVALAAQSLAEEPVPGAAVARLSGCQRTIAEFLRDEVLDTLADDERRFAVRSSLLETFSAGLCDAALERTDSGVMLAALQRANFPLVALDRRGERFRHHRLLDDVLRSELRPDEGAALHRRASAWHRAAGDRDRALRHALAAGEVAHAGELVWEGASRALGAGPSAAVERWLALFAPHQVVQHPQLALTAAGVELAAGQGAVAEHWLRSASGELAVALRAALGREGLGRMQQDAESAAARLAPESPCLALCDLIAGTAAGLRGEREAGRRRLELGARRAAVAAPLIQALCLAQLAMLALDEDHEDAFRLIERGRAQLARHGLESAPVCALPFAVSALIRARRGRIDEAGEDLRRAEALLERMTDFAAWYELETQVVLARVALKLSDVGEARARLAEAGRLRARVPDAAILHGWRRDAEEDLAAYTSRVPSSLTNAELRILQLLPTHLSFREIGDRMRVSPNTVKTQANSVYRKLDVRSRSDAVVRAGELGLLDITRFE